MFLGLLGTSSRKIRGYAKRKGAKENATNPGESLEYRWCQYDATLSNDNGKSKKKFIYSF